LYGSLYLLCITMFCDSVKRQIINEIHIGDNGLDWISRCEVGVANVVMLLYNIEVCSILLLF